MVAPVKPVVVLLGQRPSRARGREHFLKPLEIRGPVREGDPRLPGDLVRATPQPGVSDVGLLDRGRQSAGDRADEESGVVAPRDRTEVVARRARLAVRAKKRIDRLREDRIARADFVE